MTDAPETIWAAQHPYGTIEAVDTECLGTTKYTRTDHSQALIAAAYEAAGKYLNEQSKGYPDNIKWCVQDDATAVLDLTPANAQAALDKLIADAERRGMERAACEMDLAAHVMSHYGSALEVETYQSAASGIRAAMEDKKP
jgi:hypothetical protein